LSSRSLPAPYVLLLPPAPAPYALLLLLLLAWWGVHVLALV
jgi:hypothetical protein